MNIMTKLIADKIIVNSGFTIKLGTFELDDLKEHFTYIDSEKYILEDCEEYKCPICMDILSNPVKTNCFHNFCKSCIVGIKKCPLCRNKIEFTVDLKLKHSSISTEQKLMCNYCFKTYDNEIHFIAHLKNNDCNYKLIKCNMCKKIGIEKNLRNHQYIKH